MENRIVRLIDGPRRGMIIKCSDKTKEIKLIVGFGGVFSNAIYREKEKGKFSYQGTEPHNRTR